MENRKVLNKFIKLENSKVYKVVPFLAIVLLAVVARLIPHPANFAPIGGLALFSGTHFKNKLAVLIPLLAMTVSDIFLGFHPTIVYVYISFTIIFLIGTKIKNKSFLRFVFASLFSSSIFFLVTNFGVWQTGTMYDKTLYGLLQSYIMGIPFFRNTALGDLFYTVSFFYGYEFLIRLKFKSSFVKTK